MIWIPWLWLGATALPLLVWLSRHFHINRVTRLLPPLRSKMYQETPAAQLPSVTILVAAKDEESNIEACLRSLLRQDHPDCEVIAINDRSSDRTGEIIDRVAAGEARLTGVHLRHLRPGWFGKCNALREGLDRAKGQWLCFTDADCVFVSPRAVTVALRFALDKGADFLSVLPAHETDSFLERLILPACSGVLMIWFSPEKVNDPDSPTAYANGAFMLIDRECYAAIGGHEAVRTEINEDMGLARRAKDAGRRLVVVSNDDLYTVRMYESLTEIWRGWTRIFYGCFGSVWRLVVSIALLMFFSLLPWAALVCGATKGWGHESAGSEAWRLLAWMAGAACVAQLSLMIRFYALNRSHPLYGLLYPVGAAFTCVLLINAALRKASGGTITWRGTTYRGDRVESVTGQT